MKIHLFGASTPSGEALHRLAVGDLVGYSRKAYGSSCWMHPLDLNDPAGFLPSGCREDSSIWISFAPIWLLAPFVEKLAINYPERLQGLRGVVACSSSSSITKRFAANRFDRQLVQKLIAAEDQLVATCSRRSIPCCILRPSLIYGQVGTLVDHNLSRLIQLMRWLPVLPIPAETGLRQPIHAFQLAAVALHLSHQLADTEFALCSSERIALGGDCTLSYAEMISALQHAQSPGDQARRCLLLPIPNRLFFLLAAPLMLWSPKFFEAVLRMSANLSNFTPAYQLLNREPQHFPVLPLT